MGLVMRARKTRTNELNTEAGVAQALVTGLSDGAPAVTEPALPTTTLNRVYPLGEDFVVRLPSDGLPSVGAICDRTSVVRHDRSSASVVSPAEEVVRWATGRLRWERRLDQLVSE
jgi:hypothetical protein